MKNAIFALMMSLSFALAPMPVSASAQELSVSPEVSAVLLAPEYAAAVAAEVRKAKRSGRALQISDAYVVKTESQAYVYLRLMIRANADLNGWTDYGQLVATVQYGPMGELTVDSLYLKPAEGGPGGGASVGGML
jgi:hypothetical protein